MSKDTIRYFRELSEVEQDTAIEILFKAISEDYESGKIDFLNVRSEEDIALAAWEAAGGIAESAIYLPDDGSVIVRL